MTVSSSPVFLLFFSFVVDYSLLPTKETKSTKEIEDRGRRDGGGREEKTAVEPPSVLRIQRRLP